MNYDSCATEENSKHSAGVKLSSVPKQQLATDEILNRLNVLLEQLSSNNNRLDNKVNSLIGYQDQDKCVEDCPQPSTDNFLAKLHDLISDCDNKVISIYKNLDRLDKII